MEPVFTPITEYRSVTRNRARRAAERAERAAQTPPGARRKRPMSYRKPMPENRAKRFGAFDFETDGFSDRLLFGTACYEHQNKTRSDVKEFVGAQAARHFLDWLLDDEERRGVIWYAHNAGFDWRFLQPAVRELLSRGYYMIPKARMEGVFYELELRNDELEHEIIFRDSMAVLPMSLKDAMNKFSSMDKLDIGLAAGTTFDAQNEQHRAYARRDAEGLLDVLVNYDEMVYDKFSIHLRGTVAGNAYNAFLRKLPEGHVHYRLNAEVEKELREAYYGGIVSLKTSGKKFPFVRTFDINSSYPNVMRRYGVPQGNPWKTKEFDPDRPGFYYCHVKCDNQDMFHFIPNRGADEQLRWGYGECKTWITSEEVKAGRAHGYDIEVIRGYVFSRIEYPFGDFVDECERLRAAYKGMPLETVAKLMQNSLYGKFGSKVKQCEYIFTAEYLDASTGFRPVLDPLEEDNLLEIEVDNLYIREGERDSEYMLPHWAAWITANARLELLKIIDICGYENFLYCDTDSVTCLPEGARRIEEAGIVGKQYGQVKDEGTSVYWESTAPKFYSSLGKLDPKTGEIVGGPIMKCKGIPRKALTEEIMLRIHEGEAVRVDWEAPTSYMTYIKTGKFSAHYNRTPTDPHNLPTWEVNGDSIRPRKYVDTTPDT